MKSAVDGSNMIFYSRLPCPGCSLEVSDGLGGLTPVQVEHAKSNQEPQRNLSKGLSSGSQKFHILLQLILDDKDKEIINSYPPQCKKLSSKEAKTVYLRHS